MKDLDQYSYYLGMLDGVVRSKHTALESLLSNGSYNHLDITMSNLKREVERLLKEIEECNSTK